MKAFGFVIDCDARMLAACSPAFFGVGHDAQLARDSGPTVPVAPAAASVWQPLHPAEPVNTALPAAAVAAALELTPSCWTARGCGADRRPGRPAAPAFGGGVPIGGGPFGFCDRSQAGTPPA